jgi:hypothetical protein
MTLSTPALAWVSRAAVQLSQFAMLCFMLSETTELNLNPLLLMNSIIDHAHAMHASGYRSQLRVFGFASVLQLYVSVFVHSLCAHHAVCQLAFC